MASIVMFGGALFALFRYLEAADRRRQEGVHLIVESFREGVTTSVMQTADAIGKAVQQAQFPEPSAEPVIDRTYLEDVARSVMDQPDYSDPTDHGWLAPDRVEAAPLGNGDAPFGVPGLRPDIHREA